VSFTEQPRTSWRPRLRISTTSYAVQPPVPASTVSIGRGARLRPPFSGRASSGAPSMASTWPLPVSATKPMPERVPAAPVQLTVHSMSWFLLVAERAAARHEVFACSTATALAATQQKERYTDFAA
jgi:hypothetical protein